MIKLIPFELGKIWGKRSFQIFTWVLLALNLFLAWYLNLPKENVPPLSAYKAVCADISGMPENDKLRFIAGLKERIDGVILVSDIINIESRGDDAGAALAKQMKEENPGVFHQYLDIYNSGDYLTYTDSLYQEKALLDELFAEVEKVSGYDAYLASIGQNQESLRGIPIFQDAAKESFSSRNIAKSAADHAGLSSEKIRWFPAKGVKLATESSVTDIFLLLSVFLFVGGLITEEKEKGLFYITRGTRNGISACMGAKLIALLLHCLVICTLLCGSRLLYAGLAAGFCDLSASIQSISPYMQSSLSISVLEYFMLSILTKSMVLFGLGTALNFVSICSSKSFVPQLLGAGWLGVNWLAYALIPGYSIWNPLKYLSFFGLMKTEHLYGEYLNFNLANYAVPRLPAALALITFFCALGIGLSLLLFQRGKSLTARKIHISFLVPFRPHGKLLVHESYKILITNRAILIVLLFCVLLGYSDLGRTYSPSVSEQYYQDLMLTLEGELTPEKDALISAEQSRYDAAFEQIEQIDQMVATGKIDAQSGSDMKARWYSEVAFYPSFQRVLQQYDHVKQGGVFVYDTGYRYLFGTMDESFLIDFLLLVLGMVFAFGNVMAMEYQKKSWTLLSATAGGVRQVVQKKVLVCALCAAGMAMLPWIFRTIRISSVYPMHQWLISATNIPLYFKLTVNIPILLFFAFACMSQVFAVILVGAVVLLLSWWRKHYLQTLILAVLILAVPLILTLMGLDFAKWVSLYPLYGWIGSI